MKPFSVYKPDVCCDHDWVHDNYNLDGTSNVYYCDKCGATCKRDKEGKIENYSLNHVHTQIDSNQRRNYDIPY